VREQRATHATATEHFASDQQTQHLTVFSTARRRFLLLVAFLAFVAFVRLAVLIDKARDDGSSHSTILQRAPAQRETGKLFGVHRG
jgi:hypothetical protein